MDKLTPEQEAKRLYPTGHLSTSIHIQKAEAMQAAHITAARQYMGEIDRLKSLIKNLYDNEVAEPCRNAGAADEVIESHWQAYKLKHNL